MTPRGKSLGLLAGFALAVLVPLPSRGADSVPVDLSGYRPESGVAVRFEPEAGRLTIDWPAGTGTGRLALDLHPGAPLIEGLGLAAKETAAPTILARAVDPVTFLTVGKRESPPDRPPTMSVFNVFFDSPAKRPHQSYRSRLDLKRVKVTSRGKRATVSVGDVTIGPFSGTLELTVYSGSPLVHVETVVSTKEEDRAILYDSGLAFASTEGLRLTWVDTEGARKTVSPTRDAPEQTPAVRHRMIVASSDAGSIACFPPPHQFFYPRDYSDNQHTVWFGTGHRKLDDRFGFGVRQTETGGGNYAPWFNAPPGTEQRLGAFYHLSLGSADQAVGAVLLYTHNDRFPPMPGHLTFTSHWHMAIAVAAQLELLKKNGRKTPDFVRMFREMGVNMVHLAEFHGDGHQKDPGPLRLMELQAMFDECRRLSGDDLLFLPGEEVDEFLGLPGPGRHSGHWMSLFPKPVYWSMRHPSGTPFSEPIAPYGTTYRVGNRGEMVRLLEAENGLVWSAHPRIKASNWTPDIFRDEDFYKADFWLGAAWKAMPADLSSPRLGERCLNLFSDMDNWGRKKYMLGEVDVFKIDHTHELYGHMNINYVRLDRLPKFDEGWRPVLDALRAGRFFVTTGEVLIPEFRVNGRSSGETVRPSDRYVTSFELEHTFPLRFAELVSGDGKTVYRERIDLADTESAFPRLVVGRDIDLKGRTWVRLEVWDVAGNGAFTQPVWIEPTPN